MPTTRPQVPNLSRNERWARSVQEANNAGGARFRSPDEYEDITRRISLAYRNQLPNYMQPLINSIFPYERQLFRTQRNLAPQYAQLEADIYRNIAPQLEQTAFQNFANFYPQYAGINAATDLGLLEGVGGDAALANLALQRRIDPEFFRSREASIPAVELTLQKARDLLGGMDPNKLTGAELENVSRGLNRIRANTGDLSSPSNQGAISSALTFGDELTKKRSAVSAAIANVVNAIQGAGQFGQLSRSGINPMESVSGARAGAGQFFGQGIGQMGANRTVQRQPIGQGSQFASSFLQLPADLYMLERQLDKTGNWDLGQMVSDKLIPSSDAILGAAGKAAGASSREFKTNLKEIDDAVILELLDNVPVYRWNYKNEPASIKHMSPIAEDFHEQFGLNGDNDKVISFIDAFGVALAAIKALKQRVELLESKLQAENALHINYTGE